MHLAADVPQQAEHSSQGRLVDRKTGHDGPGLVGLHLDVAKPPTQLLLSCAWQRATDLEVIRQLHQASPAIRVVASLDADRGAALHPSSKPPWVVYELSSSPDQMRPNSRPRSTASAREAAPS